MVAAARVMTFAHVLGMFRFAQGITGNKEQQRMAPAQFPFESPILFILVMKITESLIYTHSV